MGTVRRGAYVITYRQHGDAWRFTYRAPDGTRRQVQRSTEEAIRAAARGVIDLHLRPGEIGSLDALPAETQTLVRRFLAMGPARQTLDAFAAYLDAKAQRSTVTASEAIQDFLFQKKDRSHGYQSAMKYQLAKLEAEFGARALSSIEADELQDWLSGLPLAPKSRRQMRGTLVSLFRWARNRGILPDQQTTAAERLERPAVPVATQPTYSAGQLRILLDACPERYRPWLVLQAFCGLRYSEIFAPPDKSPVFWSDLRWDDGSVYVRRETSKTGHPRHAHFPTVAQEWLLAYRDIAGPACPCNPPHKAGVTKQLGALVGGWLKNGLRDSFISHRVPLVGYGQTAREAGNSEAMIRRHYDDPKSEREGELWFSVGPDEGKKVMRFEKSC